MQKTTKKTTKKTSRREKGFTLIELLVVVAILGVLAAIVVPNVSKFIGSGKSESGKTELQTMATAVTALLADATAASLTDVYTDTAAPVNKFSIAAGDPAGSTPITATNIAANKLYLGNYLQNTTTKFWYTIEATGKVRGWWTSDGSGGTDGKEEIGVDPAP